MKLLGLIIGAGVLGTGALLASKIVAAAAPAPAGSDGASLRPPTSAASGAADDAVSKAITLHAIGHGGNNNPTHGVDSGAVWAAQARATPGVTAAQLATLASLGY